MAGSTFGTLFRITTWGETHGKGVGVVVDGCPAGLPLCEDKTAVVSRLSLGQEGIPRRTYDDFFYILLILLNFVYMG